MNADRLPYLHVVESPRRMAGVGAPRDTLFGVIGKTKMSSESRVLGGLVNETTKGAPIPSHGKASRASKNTDHHIIGAPSKTHIAREHYAQVPYPGAYMAAAGKRLS